ncbi:hypothetical protein PGT21_010779 [Puccinia graminis f. sp. tritici]|uniref:Uncharacterized protein n=1 Tax=Puccinia graminis f. sp. tritici TaxID=56615 RepID=A0A5B0M4U9_PUCGR|nr:hypothetical protein PGTUg99_028809 [Puccinia graminis f. sp. tritici]KAA1071531.1 hypothetical protein PGT21_010779 [Puccinia graminis f. sp. tritici]
MSISFNGSDDQERRTASDSRLFRRFTSQLPLPKIQSMGYGLRRKSPRHLSARNAILAAFAASSAILSQHWVRSFQTPCK